MGMGFDFNHAFVQVPGGHIYCRTAVSESSDGMTVLINAATADMRMWDPVLDQLRYRTQVVAFDRRGTGMSSPVGDPGDEAEDVRAIVGSKYAPDEPSDLVLVAAGDGAEVALSFAHRYPESTLAVVLLDPVLGEFPDPTPEERDAGDAQAARLARVIALWESGDVVTAAEADVDACTPGLKADDRRMLAALRLQSWGLRGPRAVTESPIRTRFAELDVPITVLIGKSGSTEPRLWAERLVREAPNATIEVMEQMEHLPMLSAPWMFLHQLQEWI